MTTRAIRFLFLTFTLAAECAADPTPAFTFTLLPSSGDIVGAPGESIGWGYSITNLDGSDFLALANLDAGTFLNGAASGLFDFPIVSPGACHRDLRRRRAARPL